MKTIGIKINGTEIVLVVLEKGNDGIITQNKESTKFGIDDPESSVQAKQFRDQINAAFDTIGPEKIGILARNAKGKGIHAPSPISFKLEGIIQLYSKVEPILVWPQTTMAYFKKHAKSEKPKNKFQTEAFDVAYYLLSQ